MPDLFPDSLRPEALRDDILPYVYPVFFAIYPADVDRLRVAEWQKRLCFGLHSAITLRPHELLHVSVAECGKPKQKRKPLLGALAEAARHFSFPAFDLVFDSVARFGKDGRACVAIADAASQQPFESLRTAIVNAQRWAGLMASRGIQVAHLTLGYGDNLPDTRQSIPPFGFRVCAVEVVMSETGQSRHERLQRWPLR